MRHELHVARLARKIGPTHAQLAVTWAPTFGKYFIIGGLGTIWICDWKTVGKFIPFWGGRFDEPAE